MARIIDAIAIIHAMPYRNNLDQKLKTK